MTNLQAALGIAQLESLDRFLLKKRWIGDLYNQLLANISLKLPVPHTDYAEKSLLGLWHCFAY